MNEFIKDVLKAPLDKEFSNGYNEAANICVGIITKKIDELFSKINSDSFLSTQEQFLLSKLKELQSETEDELRNFWSGNE